VFLENVPGLVRRGLTPVLQGLTRLGFAAEWDLFSAAAVGAPHLRKRLFVLATHPGREFVRPECGGPESGQGPTKPGDDGPEGSTTHPDRGRRQELRVAESGGEQSAQGDEPNGLRQVRELDDAAAMADAADDHGGRGKRRTQAGARADGERRRGSTGGGQNVADASVEGPPAPEREALQRAGRGEEGRTATECGWWSVEPELGRVAHGITDRVDRLRSLGNGVVPLCAAYAYRTLAARLGLAVPGD